MNSFKERCIALRKQDYSLLEIAKLTKRPKTSVYFHIRHTPLSESKIATIRKKQGVRFAALAHDRKGKSLRRFKVFNQWDENTVFLVAHFLFDGELSGRSCNYNNRSQESVARLVQAMRHLYDFDPKYYHNTHTDVLRVSYHNVALAAYLKQKVVELLAEIKGMSVSLKRVFLRAFFDDEGCIDFRLQNNSRRVRGYQKNVRILRLIQNLLCSFDIKSKVQLPNEIVVTKKSNLLLFQKEVNFSPGIYMNGNRTNSSRKKHIEKRKLLAEALASYK